MNVNDEELKIQEATIKHIDDNQDKLLEDFILSKKVIPTSSVSIFMAGSPGAGKTEFSKSYERQSRVYFERLKDNPKVKKVLHKYKVNINKYNNLFVRIDVDEIREFLPQYVKTNKQEGVKGNAHVINRAATRGLDILRDYCIDNDLSFLLDGTFGSQFSTFNKMIKKLLKQERKIIIFFIYSNPLVAWDFTQKRECVEGRNVTKEIFISQYLKAIDNVRRVKEKFGDKIDLNCVLKDDKNEVKEIFYNEPTIDKILKLVYDGNEVTEDYLYKILE